MVAEYQRRRDVIIDGLNNLPGIHCQRPQGAFYAFPNVTHYGISSEEMANRMLDGGVAVLPGTSFGEYGEGYLRLVYASSMDNIERALDRMEKVLKALP
jgi:aspartate/methionine/tyrosine aminotransferase